MTVNERITALFKKAFNKNPTKIEQLTSAGSPRKYYRIHSKIGKTVVACKGNNLNENKTFLYFCKTFKTKGLAVPYIYAQENEPWIYLLEDFGNVNLLQAKETLNEEKTLELYKKAITGLIEFQTEGAKNLDFSKCFVQAKFDENYMKFDLNYFTEHYLNVSNIQYDSNKLQKDFDTLISFLQETNFDYFMYRDFQARNIMIKNNEPYFIDFQGGLQGPLHYDLVSLLNQAKANLSEDFKQNLIDFYLEQIQKKIKIDATEFCNLFEAFALLRILQTLGAYGNRGLKEGKEHFIASIPQAVENVKSQIQKTDKFLKLPYLKDIIEKLPILKN